MTQDSDQIPNGFQTDSECLYTLLHATSLHSTDLRSRLLHQSSSYVPRKAVNG